MDSPDNKVRKARGKALKLLAAVLIGPAILCGSIWYAQRFMPKAGDDRPETAVRPPDYIAVDEAIPGGHPDAILNTVRHIVPLLAKFDNGESTLGTAFVYSAGTVVTAAHIVDAYGLDHLTEIGIYCDGRNVTAEVLEADLMRDTAVLAADCMGEQLTLAHRSLKTGERLYVSGYDFGKTEAARYVRPTTSRFDAEISFLPPDNGDPRFFKIIKESAEQNIPRLRAIDAELIPGNSGSLVTDGTGAVIGMVVLVDRRQKLTFYAPAMNIRHVLCQAGAEWNDEEAP